ncbi:hypothetical protein [Atlantibacter hermannii]|uniref:hypothetical protein n=1 Tax=Atlantibacter hermannii TaxID=565 RepID=UPI0028A6E74F|nr:hypothetical protein [Atlantibacter hermannii]
MTDNNKHLVRVGHEFAAAMSDDTPIITIAKMVTELASALDVQSARSEALAAENARVTQALSFAAPWLPTCDDELTGLIQKAKQTPTTDAWVNEQRAAGVEMFALMYAEEAIKSNNITTGWRAKASRSASEYAEQLRGGQA